MILHPGLFGRFSGDRLARERGSVGKPGRWKRPAGQGFCETCQQHKPLRGEVTKKGWKCQDCRKAVPK